MYFNTSSYYTGIVVHIQQAAEIHIRGLEVMVTVMMMIVLKADIEMRIEMGMEEKEIGVLGMMKDMEEVVIHTTEMEIAMVEILMNAMEEIITETTTTEEDGEVMTISLALETGALIETGTVFLKTMIVIHLGMHNFPLHFQVLLPIRNVHVNSFLFQ